MIDTATKLLTSYQVFLNNAKESATNQIAENKTQALNNITEAKNTANTEINANKTQAIRDYWLY